MKLRKKRVLKIDHVSTGAAARNLRVKAGKSLTYVAFQLGFSPAYISDLELGKRGWTEDLLKRFERTL